MLLPCPRCHHLNPRTEQLCELCGAELPATDENRAQPGGPSLLEDSRDTLQDADRKPIAVQAEPSTEAPEETFEKADPDRIAAALREALAQESEEGRARGEGPRARGYYLRPLPVPEEAPFPNLARLASPVETGGEAPRHETAPFATVSEPAATGSPRSPEAPGAEPVGATPLPGTPGPAPGWSPADEVRGQTPYGSPIVTPLPARTGAPLAAGSSPFSSRSASAPMEARGAQPPLAEARPSVGVDQIVCPQCKALNPAGNRFCGGCGGRLIAAPKAALAEVRRPAAGMGAAVQPYLRATLICINEDGSDGDHIPLTSGERIVGRTTDNRFSTDQFLSPRHARLILDNAGLLVEDLSSLNGTYLRIRDKVRLSPGDCFLMGRQVLRLDRFEHQVNAHMRGPDGTRYMGSPIPGGRYKLVQLGIGGIVQNVYCLPAEGATLGRERGDVVFPGDKFMSARHASITIDQEERVFLSDLNSSNGTWIKTAGRRSLHDQDYIFLGQQLFRVAIQNQ